MKTEKIIIAFHIGRGGHYWNPGHLSFTGEKNIGEILSMNDRGKNNSFINDRDGRGRFITTGYYDGNGDFLISEKEVKIGCGSLNWDNDYDTDYCQYLEDCDEKEMMLIQKTNEYVSHETKAYVEEWLMERELIDVNEEEEAE